MQVLVIYTDALTHEVLWEGQLAFIPQPGQAIKFDQRSYWVKRLVWHIDERARDHRHYVEIFVE